MSLPHTSTRDLLAAVHRGEPSAMAAILRDHLPFIRDHVHRRLGALIHWKAETDDLVQEVVAAFLAYGPRCLLSDAAHLRALLGRIAENVLRDEHDRWRAQRRDVLRERPMPGDSVIDLDRPVDSVTTPSQTAMRNETRDWVRLALELLATDDRRIIQLRELEGRSFAEAATSLGIAEDAARMRFNRALVRLTAVVRDLQGGRLADALRAHE